MALVNPPTHQAVTDLAAKWVSKHPELEGRIERAIALVAMVTPSQDPTVFLVEGSEGHRYTVKVNGRSSTCTCLDSTTGHHCKHRLATALFVTAPRQDPL